MNSTKAIKVYSVVDMAVDVIGMGRDAQRYMRTRDASLVKIHPGEKPTVFTLKHIDADAFQAFVMDAPTDVRRHREAFRLAVTGIEDLVSVKTGQPIPRFAPSDSRTLWGNTIPCFSDDDLLHVAPGFVEEIGAVAFARSFLPPNSAGSYPPPPLLLAAYTARLAHHGVAAIEKARSLEASRKSGEPEAEAPTPDGGEKATAATATE
tara:strand:+ start:1908 stop:2528 length:621 start_codon:yes stop_codon:yes gene_type:complete